MKESSQYILIFLIIINFYSCKKESNKNTISMNDPGRHLSELKGMALDHGNTDAYSLLSTAYLDFEHGDFLQIAEEMAIKFNYPQAYYDVYFQLLRYTDDPSTTLSLDSCDVRTRDKAIKYLKLAFEKGHVQSIGELGNLYFEGKFIQKDTVLGKELMFKYDSIMGYN